MCDCSGDELHNPTAAMTLLLKSWLGGHWFRYLILIMCSPLLIPIVCAISPFLCAAEVCFCLCRRRSRRRLKPSPPQPPPPARHRNDVEGGGQVTPKRDMNRSKGKERWIHDYKSSQKILLVGEGDFSFSACLARAFHTAENIVATSYLKRKSLLKKHWTSIPHLEELESLGCLLLYKVDVYKMHTHPILKNKKFDIIIFNFPHAGHYDYLCERDPELIEMHMDLVEAYFKSASKLLTKGGEVHLRHREDPPYDSWNVVWLAAKASLTLKEKVDFEKSDYPGYHNKRGGGINTNKSFPIICASTFKFSPSSPKVVNHHY